MPRTKSEAGREIQHALSWSHCLDSMKMPQIWAIGGANSVGMVSRTAPQLENRKKYLRQEKSTSIMGLSNTIQVPITSNFKLSRITVWYHCTNFRSRLRMYGYVSGTDNQSPVLLPQNEYPVRILVAPYLMCLDKVYSRYPCICDQDSDQDCCQLYDFSRAGADLAQITGPSIIDHFDLRTCKYMASGGNHVQKSISCSCGTRTT